MQFDPLGRRERARLLRKYAETTGNDVPVRCQLTRTHPDARQDKIIFTTETAARAYAQAIYERAYGSTQLYPYLCDRTPECCHWHLTSRVVSSTEKKKMRAEWERRRNAKHR